MFDHAHHQKIIHILSALNKTLLGECGAQFGGGTLISLLHDEYRWSKDIDFLCPTGPGYHKLRGEIFDAMHDPGVLFEHLNGLSLPRDITANQYGVKFPVKVDDTIIKFEIVAESRISLEKPEYHKFSPGMPCLTHTDRFAEKLLANADRWADKSVESRDLIDLGVMRALEGWSQEGAEKAEDAYPVLAPLEKAIESFAANKDYQDKCFSALEMGPDNIELALSGIALIRKDIQDNNYTPTKKPGSGY